MNLLHSLYFRCIFLNDNWLAQTLAGWVRNPSSRSPERWNYEYAAGKWAGLKDISEQTHNAVLLGYVAYLRPDSTILEIGCGSGALFPYIARLGYRRYMGIDISAVAIDQCQSFGDDKTSFQATDAETYTPDFHPDVIVLNETIYYFRQPIRTLERYSGYLAANGIFVLSLVDNTKTRTIIRCLKKCFRLIDETEVSNSETAWHCLALTRLNA